MRAAFGRSEAPPAPILDPTLIQTSRILRNALVRVHPSFRFEDRLAARLGLRTREASAAESSSHGGAGEVIAFPGARRPVGRWPTRMLIGGAVASGVSLAGAAYLARRWLSRGA